MEPFPAAIDRYGGVIIEPVVDCSDAAVFAERLRTSLAAWGAAGHRLVWLELGTQQAVLIPEAIAAGFVFHHTDEHALMLTCKLVPDAYVPSTASHYIGAGGVVINDRNELLVVTEVHHSKPHYKLPGGALQAGEHLVDAVIREVREETGIEAEFDAIVCFRHWHRYRFGKSDIYFICRLRPISEAIEKQDSEIADCRWMPVDEYLDSSDVMLFNRRVVEAAIRNPGIPVVNIPGYEPPERYEFVIP